MWGVALGVFVVALAAGGVVVRRARPGERVPLAMAAWWGTWLVLGLAPAHSLVALGLMIDVENNPDGPLFAASVLSFAAFLVIGMMLLRVGIARSNGAASNAQVVGLATIWTHVVIAAAMLGGVLAMGHLGDFAPYILLPAILGVGVGGSLLRRVLADGASGPRAPE